MRKLPKPIEKAEDIFKICISLVRNNDLKQRLESCESEIIQAAKDFEAKVVKAELHLIPIIDSINGKVTADEMIKVYTFRMAQKNKPGRSFYDKLLALPIHGRCPLCGHRIVSTIDHHLPKTHYPLFSVIPINLVPACRDCNTIKEACMPLNGSEETIHPYYDDIESEIWLKAKVINSTPCCVEFYVEKPSSWSDILGQRIEHHFKVLKLNALYSSLSAEELLNINYQINDIYNNGGQNEVKKHLIESARSRLNVLLNSWQSALYVAISNSDWFCNGGFKMN